MASQEYTELLHKLDFFIRRYYRNEMIRGLWLFGLILFVFSGLAITLEYFGHFSVPVRTTMFWCLVAVYTAVLIRFVLIPGLKVYRIGKQINHRQAAGIISGHFNEISDRLLNILELASMGKSNGASKDLIFASIDHKISQVKVFPFAQAIDLKKRNLYFRSFASALAIIALAAVFRPDILKDGSDRLLQYSVPFLPDAPFLFILENDSLAVEQGSDFEIEVKIEGKYMPANVYVEIGNNRFLMEKTSKSRFTYLIRNINNNIRFHFEADEVNSGNYDLSVLPPPLITGFTLEATVPAYTGEKNFVVENSGDVSVPAGTILKWKFTTENADHLEFFLGDSLVKTMNPANNPEFQKRFLYTASYSLGVKNEFFSSRNKVTYTIQVVPDLYPSVSCESLTDSTQAGLIYFRGIINDDYGFSRLTFNFRTKQNPDSVISLAIPVAQGSRIQDYYYVFDFSQLQGVSGMIEYYFEVWDNDAVNGSKSARTSFMEYKLPDAGEVDEKRSSSNESMEDMLEKSKKLSEEIKKDIKKLQADILNQKTSSWEQSQKMKDILSKQEDLEQMLKNLNQENQNKNDYMSNFSEQNQDILEKQKQIEELFESLMDDEMKKLMEEMNELMKDFDKSKLNELAEDMKLSYEDLNEQLDRNLELLKRLDVEESIDNIAQQMDNLAKEQEDLSEKSNNKEFNTDSLAKMQEEIEKEFNELMQDYKETLEKNQELKEPMNLEEFNQEKQDIQNEMNESQEQLQQKSRKGASKSQKSASSQMKKMSSKMSEMMESNMQSQEGENMDDLRQVLDNLIKFSFDQEALMLSLKNTNVNDPKYNSRISHQKKLNNDFSVIRDSLNALAKRAPNLGPAIEKEIKKIEQYSAQAFKELDERQFSQAQTSQQFVMTSTNNLALLLGEVLKQMQSAANQPADGQCNKPGGKGNKMAFGQMKDLQNGLKQKMKEMIEQAKNGKNGKMMNEQLGKMIAEQDKFKKMMMDMMTNGGLSPETAKLLKDINQMLSEVEKDIITKNITPQTLLRQEQIMTRLLEAEKSDYERDTEEKRESRSGKNDKTSNPEEIFKYKGVHSKFNDVIEGNKIRLTKFYYNKYREYMININR